MEASLLNKYGRIINYLLHLDSAPLERVFIPYQSDAAEIHSAIIEKWPRIHVAVAWIFDRERSRGERLEAREEYNFHVALSSRVPAISFDVPAISLSSPSPLFSRPPTLGSLSLHSASASTNHDVGMTIDF